jgi:hypothetical protein
MIRRRTKDEGEVSSLVIRVIKIEVGSEEKNMKGMELLIRRL